MADKTEVRKRVRTIIARYKGGITGSDVQGSYKPSKPPLKFHIFKFKGMRDDLNEDILNNPKITNPTGLKGQRMTFTKLESLYPQRVSDLEVAMLKLAKNIENVNAEKAENSL